MSSLNTYKIGYLERGPGMNCVLNVRYRALASIKGDVEKVGYTPSEKCFGQCGYDFGAREGTAGWF